MSMEQTYYRDAQRKWRSEHAEEYKESRQKALQAYKDFVRKQKVGKVCAHCGEEDIDRLDFHHSDPATKCFTIGTTATRSHEAVLEEIAKCELLCHTCHTVEHNKTKERCYGKWVSRSQA